MEESSNSSHDETIRKEAPQLAAVLKEMRKALDKVTSEVKALTAKVKANNYPTSDGMSYLEAKHLLLLSYCQSLVYYIFRKANGFSIEGHPVVRGLVEIRLFLEKVRPIDKKLQYQIQKLTKITSSGIETEGPSKKDMDAPQKIEDPSKYGPNPDMLVSKTDEMLEDDSGLYRPPKFAPTVMEENKSSRNERNALRREKEMLRQAHQSTYMREMVNELEGKPEEVRDVVGPESRELTRYLAKMEERARLEEEHFIRAPITRKDKQKEKHLKKSRNGLLGLTDSFYDEIKTLPIGEDGGEQSKSSSRNRKHKRRKV